MFWRRSGEWATAWLSRYRIDPFYRTEVNVISLQVAFALVILAIVAGAFSVLYHNISEAIVEGIKTGIASNGSALIAPSIVQELQQLKTENLGIIIVSIVLTTALFGYIIARITLAPTRNALAAQKQFIGNIAHELRTPLAILKTNTEVALLENNMAPDIKATLESNVEELDRISEIINNLLSLSALVRPERVEFAAVDLSAVVSDVVEKFSALAKRGEHQITVRKGPGTAVWGNATALTQIVSNLLKNAITYTPRGGAVRISVEPSPNNHVELIVQDSGVGIARKDLFRIFEPFYRGDPSRTRGAGGSGLGLAIVSELIKMHHGKVTIRSSVGRGTTVAVLFPGMAGRGKVGEEAKAGNVPNEISVDFSSH
ncbi:hypothetical protein A2704_06115 [Candidatus Kaiserbacteria bacterium RIFCSPHIGHO2_01_FULL_54_36b]|uniref:histidine kinase n=1 Tax=Candidatus Kaiserbacteria bacterium RIFCSPHIGHO2_01_FULL_54_36b TaxID=1798483 RepID=A0A1F6CRG3_9BACT|nr:MAG: hypothetical protein A2704_06115 [Candidatus Kaiserbacteria bacterium RIFCSPHIGHO2_01_FULL_54_36b]